MIVDLNKLTKGQNILFDKLFNDSKLEYISLIDNIYEQSDKSIYFLLSSVTSRDFHLNVTLIKLTQLCLVKFCLLNYSVNKIIVYDKNQNTIIKSFIQKHNIDAKVIFISSYKDLIINILKFVYIFINNFITAIYFIREKSQSRLNIIKEKKEIIMINTYFIPSMFVGNEYKDRYYPNLFNFANKKDNIFFNPTCLLGNKLPNAIKTCDESNINYVYNFDLLKISDYLLALFSSIILIKYRFNNLSFFDFDPTSIINTEIKKNIIRHSLFIPLLNYIYMKRMKEQGIDIKLFIDWFENQQLNRGFNIGRSENYPNVKSKGYQGWIVSKNYYYYHQPTKFEKDIGSIPDEIAVIGKELVKSATNYTGTQTIVSPAFRFDYVHDQLEENAVKKLILVSLPASFVVANYILKFCYDNLPNNHHSNVVINYHPVLKLGPRNYISKFKKYGDYEFSDNLFSELIINAGLVISNASSACIESLALGVPVIILQGGSPINQNPIPNTIDKNMWDECDNNVDFYNAFKRLFVEKNILAQSKAAKLIRKEYFEPVNTKSVNDFLEL
jgi:hypothetical protein